MAKNAIFTDEQLQVIERAICRVWQMIASDAQCEGPLSNINAVETCIDADRLLTDARSPEADKLVREACAKHGYSKVLRALSRKVSLT